MKRIITYITKDHDASLRDELYRCSLLWSEADCLVIGWADRFKICRVIRRNNFTGLSATQANNQTNKLSSIAANVFSSNSSELGTHVEISKLLLRLDT